MSPESQRASSLQPLEEFLQLRETISREAFLARLPGPVLLVPLESDAPEEESDFRTVSVTRENARVSGGNSVALVAKRSADAFQSFIWVGRESRCDVCIPVESVSKLQGQFTRKPDGSFELLDVGSTNGTWVNGAKLEKNKPAELHSGNRIRFGRLEVTFLSAEGFWDELSRRSGRKP